MNFGIEMSRGCGRRFASGALGGDPTGTIWENSAANATADLGGRFLVDFQQNNLLHGICDESWHWHKKGGWEQVWQWSTWRGPNWCRQGKQHC